MIEVENMFEDLRSDEIGRAICSLRESPNWNAAKHMLKDDLYAKLIEHQYVKSVSTRARFRMLGGVGFSYLYLVPPNKKRGRLRTMQASFLDLSMSRAQRIISRSDLELSIPVRLAEFFCQ
jgi:hypothetical protein